MDAVLTDRDRLPAVQLNPLARRLRGKQAEAGVTCTQADPPEESAEDLFQPLGRDGDLLLASLEKETHRRVGNLHYDRDFAQCFVRHLLLAGGMGRGSRCISGKVSTGYGACRDKDTGVTVCHHCRCRPSPFRLVQQQRHPPKHTMRTSQSHHWPRHVRQ